MFYELTEVISTLIRIVYKLYNKQELSKEDIDFLEENQIREVPGCSQLHNPVYDIGVRLEDTILEEIRDEIHRY